MKIIHLIRPRTRDFPAYTTVNYHLLLDEIAVPHKQIFEHRFHEIVGNEISMKNLKFSRQWLRRMSSCRMSHRVALVCTDVKKERIASIVRVTKICALWITLAVLQLRVTAYVVSGSPIHFTLMMEAIHPSKTSVLTRATLRYFSEEGILQLSMNLIYSRLFVTLHLLRRSREEIGPNTVVSENHFIPALVGWILILHRAIWRRYYCEL
jgi:hypothetical protein